MAIQLELVVDANPLISALLGGQALEILFNPLFRCVTTERTTWEVKRYIPMIADRSGVPGRVTHIEDSSPEEVTVSLLPPEALLTMGMLAHTTSPGGWAIPVELLRIEF